MHGAVGCLTRTPPPSSHNKIDWPRDWWLFFPPNFTRSWGFILSFFSCCFDANYSRFD
jgi:hypothetical protein